MTLIVNMIAGPGTGKSTTAAGVFVELKHAGVNCELVTEYAKDLVWGRTTTTLGNQIYIFGKQYHRLWRLLDQVDVVVTDCPLLLSLYYGAHESDAFKRLVLQTFEQMDNMNFYLIRRKAFNPSGRLQSEDEARQIDHELSRILDANDVPYAEVLADATAPKAIASVVLDELKRRAA